MNGKLRYDLTGHRFGKLVVIERVPAKRKSLWRVRCDCGGSKVTHSHYLRTGHLVSCGCTRPMPKPVQAPDGERFASISEAARFKGVVPATVFNWLHRDTGWRYLG